MITFFNYNPYRNLLKELGIKQEQLIKEGIINRQNASSLKQNKPIRTDTLDKLCDRLNCQFSDLIEHYKEEE